MVLTTAVEADYPEVIALANLAYRGAPGAKPSWNQETGVVEGQRLTDSLLREDLAAKPSAQLLLYREAAGKAAGKAAEGPLLGTVWLEPKADGVWYLGLLTVHPEMQNRSLGRTLLAAAEEVVRAHGGLTIRMTVLHVREALLAWYERRGYTRTGETQPFPYGDDRFGTPMRDDLYFVVLEKKL